MKYMLDTNTCIYIIKQKPPKVFSIFSSLKIGDICISTITLAELAYGVEKSKFADMNKIALVGFTAPLEILHYDDKAAFVYGKLRADLEKQGRIIGAYDLMIGAHAFSERLTLVTNNIAEFERIPGLRLENWV